MKDLVLEKESSAQPRHHKFTKYDNSFKDKTWMQKYCPLLENQIRKVVKEEVELAFERSSTLSCVSRSLPFHHKIEPSKSRHFELQFEGKLPDKLFTGNKVEFEGNFPVKILLLDTVSGQLITEGPLSSKRVEVFVLYGHFKPQAQEDWTKEEFLRHVVSERKEKRPLLVGQRFITLHRGIGINNDNIYFTDNSSWGRSKMFRLGAKVVGDEDQVKEAVSSAFKVKDRRGETYQKHNNPSLEDEVWRLKGIAKSGKRCQRLKENKIYNVQDLVKLYYNDESSLHKILKVSPQKWKAIIEQATTCLSSQECSNTNNLAEIKYHDVDTETTNPNIIRCPNLQQLVVDDQQNIQMLSSYACGPSQQMDQSISFNSTLLKDSLARSCNDIFPQPYQGYSTTPYPDAIFIAHQTSRSLPIQPIERDLECNNSLEGSSCISSSARMLATDISDVGVDAWQITNQKIGLDELINKGDEATLKKGKFSSYHVSYI